MPCESVRHALLAWHAACLIHLQVGDSSLESLEVTTINSLQREPREHTGGAVWG